MKNNTELIQEIESVTEPVIDKYDKKNKNSRLLIASLCAPVVMISITVIFLMLLTTPVIDSIIIDLILRAFTKYYRILNYFS
jgi:hypothetical protein